VFLLRNLQEEKDGKILVEHRESGRRYWIEAALLRPIIRNRDIHGFGQPKPATLCLVPYDPKGMLLAEDRLRLEFPAAHRYLLASKDRLVAGRRQKRGNWYALTSVAGFRFATLTRVIGGLITSGGDMTILADASVLCHSGVLVMAPNRFLIDPYYLLGVCNSTVFWAFVQHQMPTMGNGRHTIRVERVREFPLAEPKADNQTLVQTISATARQLVTEPLSAMERKVAKDSIDRMVRDLYEVD
jgi:hypothetical protein